MCCCGLVYSVHLRSDSDTTLSGGGGTGGGGGGTGGGGGGGGGSPKPNSQPTNLPFRPSVRVCLIVLF